MCPALLLQHPEPRPRTTLPWTAADPDSQPRCTAGPRTGEPGARPGRRDTDGRGRCPWRGSSMSGTRRNGDCSVDVSRTASVLGGLSSGQGRGAALPSTRRPGPSWAVGGTRALRWAFPALRHPPRCAFQVARPGDDPAGTSRMCRGLADPPPPSATRVSALAARVPPRSCRCGGRLRRVQSLPPGTLGDGPGVSKHPPPPPPPPASAARQGVKTRKSERK